tara:strand:+ start:69 stop:485 length:417 start_codon:yes stop_codon:yes gene_type:complete
MKKKPNILIVASRYNRTKPLFLSAKNELDKKKINNNLKMVNGAFEIPVSIARNINKYDGFIAIGIIIKGETPNFNLISQAITNGIMELSILYKKPIGNAILTCLNSDQAEQREHKGKEAVEAVLDILNVGNNRKLIKK